MEWKKEKWEFYVTDQDIVEGEERKYYIRDPEQYRFRVVRAVVSSSPEKMVKPEEIVLLASRSYILRNLWIDIKEVLGGPKLWYRNREEVGLQPGEMK